tara:strand:+ start:1392 stop:1592 length:201 start_codon:yes stop_codon:yes gene_type:complete
MTTYKTFEDIKYDLKRIQLERQIALEEIKGLKYEIEKDLGPYQWLQTAFKTVKGFGLIFFIKKLLK